MIIIQMLYNIIQYKLIFYKIRVKAKMIKFSSVEECIWVHFETREPMRADCGYTQLKRLMILSSIKVPAKIFFSWHFFCETE